MYDALAIVFLAALRRTNEAVALPVMIIVAESYAHLSHFAGARGGIMETRSVGDYLGERLADVPREQSHLSQRSRAPTARLHLTCACGAGSNRRGVIAFGVAPHLFAK